MNKNKKQYTLSILALGAFMAFGSVSWAQMSAPATMNNERSAPAVGSIPRTAAEARYIPGNPVIIIPEAEKSLNQVGQPGFNAVPPQNPDKLYTPSVFPTEQEKNAQPKPEIPKITASQAEQLQPGTTNIKSMSPEDKAKIEAHHAKVDKCIKDNAGDKSRQLVCIVSIEGFNASGAGLQPADPRYQNMPTQGSSGGSAAALR